MSDTTTLKAERARLVDQIAALTPALGRPLPGRKVPSDTSGKLDALKRQLAALDMKLRRAKTLAG